MRGCPFGIFTRSAPGQPCGSVRSEICCLCTATEIAVVRVARGLQNARPWSVFTALKLLHPSVASDIDDDSILSSSLCFSAFFLNLLNSMAGLLWSSVYFSDKFSFSPLLTLLFFKMYMFSKQSLSFFLLLLSLISPLSPLGISPNPTDSGPSLVTDHP